MDELKLVIPGVTDERTLLAISRAKTYTYYLELVDKAQQDICAFCPPDPEKNKKIVAHGGWVAFHNLISPIKNTRRSIVLVPMRHVTASRDLLDYEKMGFFDIQREICRILKIEAYGLICRDGDARLLAGTIEHLHYHIAVPNGVGRVETPFAKTPKENRDDIRRAIIFEKVRQAGSENILTDAEYELVEDRMK